MTDANSDDATEEIEVLFPVDIPHMLHEAVVHWYGIGKICRDRRKYEFLLLAVDFVTAEAGLIGRNCPGIHSVLGSANHDKPLMPPSGASAYNRNEQ